MAVEDAITVHKTEVVYCDKKTGDGREKHYRLNAENIVKIVYDYAYFKRFFGLKKELEERVVIYTKDEDIPSELIVCEHEEANFRRFRGGLRTFAEENKIELIMKSAEESVK